MRYVDSDGNLIAEGSKEVIMSFHSRLIVNGFPYGCKEGDYVLVFDEENVEKIFEYFNNKIIGVNDKLIKSMKEEIKLNKEYVELSKSLYKKITELKEDNENLKLLNNQLTLKVIELKEDRG